MSSTPWMPCLVCNYLRQHWHTHLADLADLADLFNEGRKSEHMSRCGNFSNKCWPCVGHATCPGSQRWCRWSSEGCAACWPSLTNGQRIIMRCTRRLWLSLTVYDFLGWRPCQSRACRSAPSRSSGKGSRRSRKAAPASACSGLACSPVAEHMKAVLLLSFPAVAPWETLRCAAASNAKAEAPSWAKQGFPSGSFYEWTLWFPWCWVNNIEHHWTHPILSHPQIELPTWVWGSSWWFRQCEPQRGASPAPKLRTDDQPTGFVASVAIFASHCSLVPLVVSFVPVLQAESIPTTNLQVVFLLRGLNMLVHLFPSVLVYIPFLQISKAQKIRSVAVHSLLSGE